MPHTPKEIVQRCLRFETPERMPRDLWILPWAQTRYGDFLKNLQERYPSDFGYPAGVYRPSPRVKGDPYSLGQFTDEWGCVFDNIQEGAIGEVHNPTLKSMDDWKSMEPPYETLPEDWDKARDAVNRSIEKIDLFTRGGCCARPWERLQFLRGTQNAMVDVLMPEDGCGDLLKKIHDFHMKEYEFWTSTDVDCVMFMDDWGAQKQLLIPPYVWRALFKPLYKEYADLAHSRGKFILMHSDGFISDIYEDLVEIGIDAVNSQLFCMDMADLEKRVKGKITFWGEIDRQHVLPAKDPQVGRDAVRKVAKHLYDPRGGIIAQMEFGLASNPEIAQAVFEEWDAVQVEAKGR